MEITGKQCDFPMILEACDVVFDWITRNGYDVAGPPREIWRDDKGEHMEIAAPFQSGRSGDAPTTDAHSIDA